MDLTPEECLFLKKLIREPLDYYQTLASHPRATPETRENAEFFTNLYRKLEPPHDDGNQQGISNAAGPLSGINQR